MSHLYIYLLWFLLTHIPCLTHPDPTPPEGFPLKADSPAARLNGSHLGITWWRLLTMQYVMGTSTGHKEKSLNSSSSHHHHDNHPPHHHNHPHHHWQVIVNRTTLQKSSSQSLSPKRTNPVSIFNARISSMPAGASARQRGFGVVYLLWEIAMIQTAQISVTHTNTRPKSRNRLW